jgi:hypothetical protein
MKRRLRRLLARLPRSWRLATLSVYATFRARARCDERFRTVQAVTDLLEERGFVVARRTDAREYVADVVYASRRG